MAEKKVDVKKVADEAKKATETVASKAEKTAEKATVTAKKATATAKKTAETVKTSTEKATGAAKKATSTAKKATTKKVATKTVILQMNGDEVTIDDLVAKVEADFKAENKRKTIDDIKVYIKPEDCAAYYVVTSGKNEYAGRINL